MNDDFFFRDLPTAEAVFVKREPRPMEPIIEWWGYSLSVLPDFKEALSQPNVWGKEK